MIRATPPPRQRRLVIIETPSSCDSSTSESSESVDYADVDENKTTNRSGKNSHVDDLTSALGRVNLSQLPPPTTTARSGGKLFRTQAKRGKIKLLDSDSDHSSSVEFEAFASPSSYEFPIDIDAPIDVDKPIKKSAGLDQRKNGIWHHDAKNKEYTLEATATRNVPQIRVPADIYDNLFDHQRDGVTWMAGLHCQKIGLALCDDMGMGKSRTTLTFIGGLMRTKTIRNALIVAPLSVLRSWEGEAEKVLRTCVPRVGIVVVSSTATKHNRTRALQDALECSLEYPHLIITTYGLVSSAPLDFIHESHFWDYAILDEAHMIKNPSTRISKSCKRICRNERTRRVILTGTPIMNHLKELWALMDFATSGKVLGTQQSFVNSFANPIEAARDKAASTHMMRIGEKANNELQEILRPYFMQRLKIDFLADKLPVKTDFVVWTHLSKKQRSMYEQYVDSGESAVASVLRGESTSPLEAVTWLKKLCGHPVLVDVKNQQAPDPIGGCNPDDLSRQSSKLQVLVTLIEKLRRQGHKTLVFSQSTRMLDIIEKVLHCVSLARIDGSTKERDRQLRVDNFNRSGSKVEVMLLSTKAAGVGLTLIGADRVVVYDPSWNPAEDSQAVDRCYRIGQTKEVCVFRLIAAGTVEEKMYEKQVHKDGIRRAVMTSTGSATTRYFDRNELRALFKLGAEGKCDVLERLQQRDGISSNATGGSMLSFHKGVVGVSSHDGLYSASQVVTLLDGEACSNNPNPFSNPVAQVNDREVHKNNAVSYKISGRKVLGRSQKALLNKERRLRVDLAKSDSGSHSDKENEAVYRDDAPLQPQPRHANLLQAGVETTLQRAKQLAANGKHSQSITLLMDLLDTQYQNLGKDTKMQVHMCMALAARDLGWL